MKFHDVQEGMELIYGGGPTVGGWFTVLCRVKVLRCGKGRFQVRHEDGPTLGKVCWVTPSHLSKSGSYPANLDEDVTLLSATYPRATGALNRFYRIAEIARDA